MNITDEALAALRRTLCDEMNKKYPLLKIDVSVSIAENEIAREFCVQAERSCPELISGPQLELQPFCNLLRYLSIDMRRRCFACGESIEPALRRAVPDMRELALEANRRY